MESAPRARRRRTLVAPAHANQIKTRERVRDLAEDYLETSIICADTLMDGHAIYQYRSFERASLLYASEEHEQLDRHRVGLWERSVDQDELPDMSAAVLP